MSRLYSGGCACGAARYGFAAEPVAMSDCYCRQCQRDSGTSHGSYLTFIGADACVSGEIRCFEIAGDGGTVKARNFCPTCGTQLFISFPALPGVLAVRAGTLDDPSRYRPGSATWTVAAQDWAQIAPDITRFERMPAQN